MLVSLKRTSLNFLRLLIRLLTRHADTKTMLARDVGIARHLGFLNNLIVSDAKHILKGHHKRDKTIRQAGKARFAYVVDIRADRPIRDESPSNIHVRSDKADVTY